MLFEQIDITKPVKFLSEELRTKAPSILKKGDKLIIDITSKVFLKDSDRPIIVNIEPQSSYQENFSERVAKYNRLLNIKHN